MLGGKKRGTAAPRLLVEARQPGLGESLAPFADDLPWRAHTGRDDIIGKALRREEHDFGSHDISLR